LSKIGVCSECGLVKTIYAKGKCKKCYQRILRQKLWRKHHPLTSRKCKNCGKTFKPKRTNRQLFCSKSCRGKWDSKLDRLKHPISKIYLGSRICECGRKAYIEIEIRDSATKGKRGRFRFFHKIWNPKKYKKLRKILAWSDARTKGFVTKTCYRSKTFPLYYI